MPNTKLSALVSLTGAGTADGDLFYVDDISAGASGSKSITTTELAIALASRFTTTIVSTLGTITTTDKPILDGSVTWNDAAVTFTAFKLNATSTASAAASNIVDIQLAGVSKFLIDKTGAVRIVDPLNVGGAANNAGSIALGGSTVISAANSPLKITLNGAGFSAVKMASGTFETAASIAGAAGLNIPHGTLPTSPVNGDMWTTTAGAFIRINGVTKTFTLS